MCVYVSMCLNDTCLCDYVTCLCVFVILCMCVCVYMSLRVAGMGNIQNPYAGVYIYTEKVGYLHLQANCKQNLYNLYTEITLWLAIATFLKSTWRIYIHQLYT